MIDNLLYQAARPGPYAWKWGNGDKRGITLDTDGRLVKLETPGVQSLSYGYTANDQVQSISDGIVSGLSSSFSWDGSGRLKTVSRGNGDNQSVDYDLAGNRSSHTRAGQGASYQYGTSGRDWLTQVGGQSLGWDAHGQMLSDGPRSYSWDGFGRLASAAGSSYSYNALNQRVRKTGPACSNHFIYLNLR
jgi:YD repeat-containing protein